MKCFVSVLSLLGVAAAAPQYLADTPEVQNAKIAFAQAYNKAARGSAIALQESGVNDYNPEDPDFSPPAVPYVHEEIPAEPYVHIEPEYVYQAAKDEATAVAPVAQAAPVVQAVAPAQAAIQAIAGPIQQSAFAYNLAPFQQYSGIYAHPGQFAFPAQYAFAQPQPQRVAGGCYNNKGEGVECRTQF